MSNKKKEIREKFRNDCFKRDKYSCVMCGFKSSVLNSQKELDAHHITDRNLIPNQGMTSWNGISLCETCHIKAEEFHSTGIAHPGYSVEDLYKKIGSSIEIAEEYAKKLK